MSIDPDLVLVVGLIITGVAIPSIISAISDSSPPRISGVLAVVGLAAVVFAVTQKPGGYVLTEIPGIVISVIGRVL